MASKSFEGQFKAWLLDSEPAGWDTDNGGTITSTDLSTGTRLKRLVSDGGISYTYNENSASQALIDQGKVSHNAGTREITGGQIIHEIDFPLEDDSMYSLYSYGDTKYLIVAPESPDDEPADGAQLIGFEIETGEPTTMAPSRDTKQNFQVNWFAQDWDFKAVFDSESS